MLRTTGVFCVIVVMLAFGLKSNAQVTTGTISGTVADSTGAVLPGADIVILNEDTGISRTVQADAAGRYSATTLSLGNYRVTASLAGFQTQIHSGILLTLGRVAIVNMELQVGAITQTVEVTGEAPLVQTTDATVGYLVNDTTIRDMPLNGRDLSQLILLNPGVGEAMNASRTNAYNGWGKKMSISGARAQDNAYFLDGSYIGDMNRHAPAGPSGALLGAETVREFQVLTNSYSAQYGRQLGGVITAVTKSGTNAFHGSAYEFHRNENMDAARWEDNRVGRDKPAFVRNQFGATVGGPIAQDQTFFFLAYEGMRQVESFTKTATVPDLNARMGILPNKTVEVSPTIAPYVEFFPLPSSGGQVFEADGTAEYIFVAKEPTTEDFWQTRIDHQFSDSDSFFARFTASNAEENQARNYPDFRVIRFMGTRLLTLSETHIFSPRALNTFRASFNRVDPIDQGLYPDVAEALLSVPGQVTPSLAPGSGVTSWSGNTKPLDRWVTNRFNFKNDVNLTLGGHSLQFGGMIERLQFNMDQPNRPYGEWTFRNLEAFLKASPRRYRGTPPQSGSSIRGWRQWFAGLYLQDDWQVRPGLTLNLGVRWEPYTPPDEVNGLIANCRRLMDPECTVGAPYWENKSWGDIGPRVGFAWSPFQSGTTSVRGGAGLFFIPNDPLVYRITATRSSPLYTEYRLSNPKHFPDALAEIASREAAGGEAQAIPFDNFRSPRAFQYNLNLQQQLGESSVATIGFTGNRGISLLSIGDYNAPLAEFNGTTLEVIGGENATRFNPNFEGIVYFATNANSWYNALTVSFQRRFAAGLQMQVAYTWAKTISEGDSYSVVDMSGAGPGRVRYAHDMGVDKGLSGWSVGRNLRMNYSYDLPLGRDWSGAAGHLLGGWQLTGIISLQDGQPFTVSNARGATPTALSNLGFTQYPNVISSFTNDQIIQGSPSKFPKNQYFNPEAFSAVKGAYEFGNVARNTLIGPGLASFDFGLTKNAQLTEQWQMQFRAEFFNMFNRPNFAKPNTGVFRSGGRPAASAGFINSTVTTSRQIQLGLKLVF